MRTVKTADQVTSEVQDVYFGFCLDVEDEGADSYKTVDDMTVEEREAIAKRCGVSLEFLTEVNAFLRDLRDATHSELADLHSRIGNSRDK